VTAASDIPPDPGLGADVINPTIDHAWLSGNDEDVLEPDLPIVDAHVHMGDRPGARYLPPDLLGDIRRSGHAIVANVHVEDGAGYRPDGPVELRPVGETEIMASIPAGWGGVSATRINAAIVGHADFCLGRHVNAVLEAHIEAGRGRFRGIRQIAVWTAEPSLTPRPRPPKRPAFRGMLADPRFREGFACLAPLGLSFDAWLYHPQLPELVDLARSFPQTTIVVDHLGGLVRVGPYRGREDDAFADWAASIAQLAHCPNVTMKLGGLGMRLSGFALRERSAPPSSLELGRLWRPFVERCIEAFGAERCMFEGNFPVDKAYFAYRTVWNAFKRIAAAASADEKRDLFSATASRVYRLAL
jgi:predicted TIM-barrel fold metal-dependent hydrolase